MGAKDGFPIALGYFAVAIAFGVASVTFGFPWWSPIVISLTNFTGSGQAVGVQLLATAATTLAELAVTMIIINIRYALMSVSISQRLSPKVTIFQRCILAFGMTDENFAVAISRNREITFGYMIGVELTAFSGWVGGTIVGALAGNFLPPQILTAFGIALPAMFVAIIVPPCKKSVPILIVTVTAVALSCLFYYVPYLRDLNKGWVYVICGLTAACLGALIFPVKEDPMEEGSVLKSETVSEDPALLEESTAEDGHADGKEEEK